MSQEVQPLVATGNYMILHPGSGTFFPIDEAVVVDLNLLSEDEREDFEWGSDSDRRILAEEYGQDLVEIDPDNT